MINETYSAGLMSQSFWFIEMKKLIKLIADNKTEQEISELCIEQNLFGAAKEYRARRMYGYLRNRVKNLDPTLIELFINSDLQTQKLINLIAVLKGDRLFFDFIFEIYREKSILGVPTLNNADVNIFFKNKEVQSEEVANWTDSTKKKLCATYLNFMVDANLLTVVEKQKTITPPILDIALERYLEVTGNGSIVKAITGRN